MIHSQKALIFLLFIVFNFHSKFSRKIIKNLCSDWVASPDSKAEDRHGYNMRLKIEQ